MRGGDPVRLKLRPHRSHGQTAHIKLRALHVPRGVRVSIDGSAVTIRADSGSLTGRATITLRASDGEVARTIHVRVRVTRPKR